MHEAMLLDRIREHLPRRLAPLALARTSRCYRDEHLAPAPGRTSELFGRITRGREHATGQAKSMSAG